MISIEEIKQQIKDLADQHHATEEETLDDFKDIDWLEYQATRLIVSYAESRGYLVEGFPTEKRLLPEEALDDDYFCSERYQHYLDRLALDHPDIADLLWYSVQHFWPEQYRSKEQYMDATQGFLESGIYEDFPF